MRHGFARVYLDAPEAGVGGDLTHAPARERRAVGEVAVAVSPEERALSVGHLSNEHPSWLQTRRDKLEQAEDVRLLEVLDDVDRADRVVAPRRRGEERHRVRLGHIQFPSTGGRHLLRGDIDALQVAVAVLSHEQQQFAVTATDVQDARPAVGGESRDHVPAQRRRAETLRLSLDVCRAIAVVESIADPCLVRTR